DEGTLSKAPLREAYGQWRYIKLGIAGMFGIIAGQATLWYTSQFYSLYFLTQTMKVDALSATLMLGVAVALAAPFNVFFGALSAKVGRKPLIIGGCLLAALLYFPIFQGLAHFANPALDDARRASPVQVTADAATCSFQFNPVGAADFTTSCDIADRKSTRLNSSHVKISY